MSFAEVIAEIPSLTPEQLREVMACAAEAEKMKAAERKLVYLKEVDGRILIGSSRTIKQSEIDKILEDFP